MEAAIFEVMQEQVRAIYRAATGADIPAQAPKAQGDVSVEEVTQRFADLELLARSTPTITERVPPFSFQPLVDVIDHRDALVVEVAIPGVDVADVTVEHEGEGLVISGVRKAVASDQGRPYLHAEIPRGPFRRVVPVPFSPAAEPAVEGKHGLIRIRIAKP